MPSFLALRFRVVNRLERRARIAVVHDGDAVGRVTVPAGGREVLDVEGQRTGALEVRAPEGTAEIAVRPGAG